MPTTLLRHSITETPDIAEAIDTAEALWPDTSRADALRRLIAKGAEAARLDLATRRAAIDKWAGSLPDVYLDKDAQAMKDEWPA
ncbi:MAG: hypothetical protein LBV00_00735 [Propionibacteriaceae bacterium]|jgi:hypothetical protein|nr:hypothetical protein [Propionibacteriaceae bacterium]